LRLGCLCRDQSREGELVPSQWSGRFQVADVAGIVDRLLGFLEVGKEFVTAETLIQIKDLLRRFPDIAPVVIAALSSISPQVRHLARVGASNLQRLLSWKTGRGVRLRVDAGRHVAAILDRQNRDPLPFQDPRKHSVCLTD
jgi:hypothetical protein